MSVSEKLSRVSDVLTWGGVDRPSRALGFFIALVVLVASLAFFIPGPTQILSNMPLSSASRDSDRAAQAVAAAVASGEELVILVGGSTSRELTPSDRFVSNALTTSCGRRLRFINLGTSSQTLADSWALTEYAARSSLSTVIIGMNYYRFEEDLATITSNYENLLVPVPRPASLGIWLTTTERRFVLPWTPLTDLIRALRRAIPTWTWDNVAHFMRKPLPAEKLVQPEEADPFQNERNAYGLPVLSLDAKQAIVAEYLAARTSGYSARAASSRDVWYAFAKQITRWGASPVFMVLPEDPVLEPVRQVFGPTFDNVMSSFSASGYRTIDFRRLSDLEHAHFYDQQHLVASGRRLFWPHFLQSVIAAVPGCRSS